MMHFNQITLTNIRTIYYVFITISFFANEVYSEWNTRDYMKREHSLLKPYQGKMNK